MNAMLHQLDAKTVLHNFSDIAKAGKQLISTSIPASELDTFVNLSLKARRPAGVDRVVRAAEDQHRRPRLRPDPHDGLRRDRGVRGTRRRLDAAAGHQKKHRNANAVGRPQQGLLTDRSQGRAFVRCTGPAWHVDQSHYAGDAAACSVMAGARSSRSS